MFSSHSAGQRRPDRTPEGARVDAHGGTATEERWTVRPALPDPEVAELRARLERAEAARDAAGGFTSYMAHELRGPLTAMIGMAELLGDTQLSPDQREMLGIMNRGAQNLVGIINNVLDLAKLDAGKLELEARPFEFRGCLEECLDLLSATAAQKGLELAYTVDEKTPGRLLGDVGRLRQVLLNILGNAIKFTETGHIAVSVATRRRPDGLQESHFAISDTGPGIPADRLESVFGEFAQSDATTAGRYGGTGLGLSITRRLVGMMGGRVWAESDGKTGTTVHFTISARSADTGDSALPGRHPLLFGKRILIIHDNATVGGMLGDQLGRWGVQARQATRTPEALDWLKAGERYDLILINQQVAELDGRSLAADIRRIQGEASAPFVLLTSLTGGWREEGAAGGGEHARFAAYLAKPVKLARLHEVLLRLFSAEPVAAVDGRHAEGTEPAATTVSPEVAPAAPHRARDGETAGKRSSLSLAGARVLVADDDPAVRRTMERMMRAEGSEVKSVADGSAMLDEFDRFIPDVVLLDATMPGLNGFDACRRLKADPATRLTPVVLVTGLSSDADRLRGIEAGADAVIIKPFDRTELLARVRVLADLKRFTDGFDGAESVILAMARCIEGRDPETHGHCDRLSSYAARLGQRLSLNQATVTALRLGGIVHDIGKVVVPDAILRKNGPLTDEEWTLMRIHPVEGERICGGLTRFRAVLPIIRYHHERLDGSGYPDGLSGEQIPVAARVLQVVDIWDALTTTRPYKQAMPHERALEIMRDEVARGWRDSDVFEAFHSMMLEEREAPQEPFLAKAV